MVFVFTNSSFLFYSTLTFCLSIFSTTTTDLLSQELAKRAEIVFAPYNYVLDPSIRKAMQIDITNTVIVLDEAHNVEDNLRECGSMTIDELEICDLFLFMNSYAIPTKDQRFWENAELIPVLLDNNNPDSNNINNINNYHQSTKTYVWEVAHELMIFLERVLEINESKKTSFYNNEISKLSGDHGLASAAKEYEKFPGMKDDTSYECAYYG